jgi:hypothetical protein
VAGGNAYAQSTADRNSRIEVSDQTQFAIDYYSSRGVRLGFVLDKANAKMVIFENGQAIAQSPTLYGRGEGGDERPEAKATPEGTFNLELLIHPDYDRWYGGSLIVFEYRNPTLALAIHITYQGNPAERRDQRLATPTPDDNNISNGCINVPIDFYNQLIDALHRHVQMGYANVFGGHLPILGSMPRQDDANFTRTRAALGIPADFQPQIRPDRTNGVTHNPPAP